MDPRLPGTDFMDTFLVTYRYFTTGKFVLQSLVNFYNQLEEQRTGKRRLVQSNQDSVSKDNNDNEENLSKCQFVIILVCSNISVLLPPLISFSLNFIAILMQLGSL